MTTREPSKNTSYYNEESRRYSQKRYPTLATTFTHFLFTSRIALLSRMLRGVVRGRNTLALLEIGCADGIVISEMKKRPEFSSLLGVDLSPEMVAIASERVADERVSFFVRDDEKITASTFDIVVEVGVLNLTDFSKELSLVSRILTPNGYYICSIAGNSSLSAVLKPENRSSYAHLLSYSQYEEEMKKFFSIERKIAYGLFIPYLWRFPRIARTLQPFVESLLRSLFPKIFHEQLYILQHKKEDVIS